MLLRYILEKPGENEGPVALKSPIFPRFFEDVTE
jgi:hypothetical protein